MFQCLNLFFDSLWFEGLVSEDILCPEVLTTLSYFLHVVQRFAFHKYSMPAWLTRHFVEQSFSCAIISLQVFTIQRPVNVCNETKGLVAFSNFLIPLGNGIDVYWAIIGSHCEIRTIWRKFHFVNDFFSIFDMNHFCHISIRIKSKVISS